ncbi:respiratory nitrate reductase, alpha subunit domain protein [Mycobacterium xenopi 4042]|uniref:Respiratory nitrate reductase, alpha subunit domain protein n=1 Tax=Mycobacterium xenopi 4042 TaxID=1299334 RepID=X8DZW2_MYCXE|nr:respiratory nitrate reductase, alpha subunit domain protein [Mycobacterium xenopi 4042]
MERAHATNGERTTALVRLPSFDTIDGHGETVARGVPVRRLAATWYARCST